MKVRNTELRITCADVVSRKATRVIFLNITATDVKIKERKFRQACTQALVLKRPLKSITVAVADYADGNFLLIGAAKILAQEIVKLGRQEKAPQEIVISVSDRNTFEVFDKTIRGYINHLQNDLGWGPYVTVDAIIELKEGIILIERSNPPYGWALPGGFVDYGESLEKAVVREAKEETNMKLVNVRQLKTYSDPKRDPRFPTITTVFIAKGVGRPKFGDDAKGLKVVPYKDLLKLDYAFDHRQVIKDYLRGRKNQKGRTQW